MARSRKRAAGPFFFVSPPGLVYRGTHARCSTIIFALLWGRTIRVDSPCLLESQVGTSRVAPPFGRFLFVCFRLPFNGYGPAFVFSLREDRRCVCSTAVPDLSPSAACRLLKRRPPYLPSGLSRSVTDALAELLRRIRRQAVPTTPSLLICSKRG